MDICKVDSMIDKSVEYLKGSAEKEYVKKYYDVEICCPELSERERKHSLLVLKYIDPSKNNIVDYINKKLSGELDHQYKKRIKQKNLRIIETKWECDMYNDQEANCCDWKAIEW